MVFGHVESDANDVLGPEQQLRHCRQNVENFGSALGDRSDQKNAELKIAYLKKSGFFLELIQYVKGNGKKVDTSVNNIGSSHICFDVKNFNSFLKRLKRNKVKFIGVPTTIPRGPNKNKLVLYFEDIDNNTIEFISAEKLK